VDVAVLIRHVFLSLVAKMSYRFLKQRINIKFCVKLGKNVTPKQLFEAYGGEAMKKSNVFQWPKRFKQDHESVEDDRSDGPTPHKTDENVETELNPVNSDRRLGNRAMVVQPKFNTGTVKKA
jgi:hypothetical protein